MTMSLMLLVLAVSLKALWGFHVAAIGSSRISETKLFDAMDDRDWRAFRARLVSKEQEGFQTSERLRMDDRKESRHEPQEHWIHEQTILEKGCVLVHTPRPQDIYGLGRQCLYKSVVLVLETNAQETIGIILNRPTVYMMEHLSTHIGYGGDECSWQTKEPQFYVLSSRTHGLPILPGLSVSTLDEAEKADDLSLFCGHISWSTDEIVSELDRGIWKCLSIDVDTMRQTLNDSKNCREELLAHISESSKASTSAFDERMHEEWIRMHLSSHQEVNDDEAETKERIKIKTGDILRSSNKDHSFLFADQEFHKSLLLVIQEDDDFTVAVLLNHPTQASESMTGLPIRYGGNFRYLEDDTVMPPFCLHYLGGVVGGEHVGDHFYKASIDQAASAIDAGLANPDDFLVVQGLTVWSKDELSVGPVESGCFERVESKLIPQAWRLLSTQRQLSPLTMDANVEIARHAWNLGSEKARESDSRLITLGMDAVKTWSAVYLLDDSNYRP